MHESNVRNGFQVIPNTYFGLNTNKIVTLAEVGIIYMYKYTRARMIIINIVTVSGLMTTHYVVCILTTTIE